jgi:hypothetical protein
MKMTDEERRTVLKEAIRLIELPETFKQGDWKCPVRRTQDGRLIPSYAPMGQYAVDDEGQKMYAYCVEGAVNQAAINMLGVDRARELQAAAPNGQIHHSTAFADLLSINETAFELFREDFRWGPKPAKGISYARAVNDVTPVKEKAHLRVLQILRTRLSSI